MLKVVIPPTQEPVSLTEAKAHLRVDFSDDDTYISGLITAARDYAEGFQRRSLAVQTLELIHDSFPPCFRLQRPPVVTVQSIKYRDNAGNELTVPAESYFVDVDQENIVPSSGYSWPSAALAPSGAVRVRYTAGTETIPQRTKQAILLMIGHWYENREAVVIGKTSEELPLAVTSLLWMDRS